MAAGTLGPSVLPAVAEILRLVLPPRPLSRTQSWGEQESSWGGWTGLCWRLGLPVPPANDRSRNLEGTWETDAFSGTHLQTGTGGREGKAGLSQDLTTDHGRLSFARNHSWSFAALERETWLVPFLGKPQNHGRGETWEVKLMRAGAEEIVEAQRR